MPYSILSIICLLTVNLTIHAQTILENSQFEILDTLPCRSDTTVMIVQPRHWEIYQTENNLWDGERTESCISFHLDEYGSPHFNTAQINLNLTLFVRYNPIIRANLIPNTIYGIYGSALGFWAHLADCLDRTCSGYFLRTQIPDSSGLGSEFREYWFPIDHNNHINEGCFGSERFDRMKVDELVLQMRFDPNRPLDDSLRIVFSHFEPVERQETLTEILIGDQYFIVGTQSYDIHSFELTDGYAESQLVIYDDDSRYPGHENIFYLDAILANNVDQRKTINIDIIGSFILQPFVQIRGGLIKGSDSLRHQVNLRMNHGQFCLNNPFEAAFEKSNHFIYQSGSVNFSGGQSCMQFSSGSQLIIAEDAHLTLGLGGQGILALRSGGSIRLEENSRLTLDLNIEMHELAGDRVTNEIECHLSTGARLDFSKNCRLSNRYSNNAMHLMVFLNNGSVDLSNLSAQERSLIKFQEEDLLNKSNQHKTQVYPNPAKDVTFVSSNAALQTIEIISPSGQMKTSIKVNRQYVQPVELVMGDFVPGTYFLRLKYDDGSYEIRKVIKF